MPALATTLPSPYPARVRLHRSPSGPRPRRASPEAHPLPDSRGSLRASRRSASLDLPASVSEDESESQYSPSPSPERPSLELFIPKINRASTMTVASAFHDIGTLPVTPGLGLDMLMTHFDSLIRERGIPTTTNSTWRGPVLQSPGPSVALTAIDLDTSHHRHDADAPTATHSDSTSAASSSSLEPNAFNLASAIRGDSFTSTVDQDAKISSLDWDLREHDDAGTEDGHGYAVSVARSSFMSVSSRYTVELGTMQAGPEMDELKEQFALLMRENRALARSSKEALSSREEDDTTVKSEVIGARENPEPVQPRPADDVPELVHSSSISSSPSASPSFSALSLHNQPVSPSSSSSSPVDAIEPQPQPEPEPEPEVVPKDTRAKPHPTPTSKKAVPIRVRSVMRRPKPKARVLRIANPAGPPLPPPHSTSTELLTPRSASASFYATSSTVPHPAPHGPIAGPSSSPAIPPTIVASPPSPHAHLTPATAPIQATSRSVKPTARAPRSRPLPLPINSGPRLLPTPPRSTTPNLVSERKTPKPSHSAPASIASTNTTFSATSMSYHPWESSQPAAFASVPALAGANAGPSGEREQSASLSVPLVPNRWKDPSPEPSEETRQSTMLGPLMKRWLNKRWHRLNGAIGSSA